MDTVTLAAPARQAFLSIPRIAVVKIRHFALGSGLKR